ncbi:hypothetical protein AAFP35_24290 [Gordonia sp. CPCC 206044]|uniref:hypothetical protein n=1 Tax=Gordonia sp. CPCC 206044 TaxID=3140793 RepID=UPI003AF34CA7
MTATDRPAERPLDVVHRELRIQRAVIGLVVHGTRDDADGWAADRVALDSDQATVDEMLPTLRQSLGKLTRSIADPTTLRTQLAGRLTPLARAVTELVLYGYEGTPDDKIIVGDQDPRLNEIDNPPDVALSGWDVGRERLEVLAPDRDLFVAMLGSIIGELPHADDVAAPEPLLDELAALASIPRRPQ